MRRRGDAPTQGCGDTEISRDRATVKASQVRKGGLPPLTPRYTQLPISLNWLIIFFSLPFFFFFSYAGSAQQIGEPTRQHGVSLPRGVYAVRNAHIVTVSGPDIDNGTVIIRDGKIEAVGATVNAPAGAQTIDASGLWVYPGMIDAGSSMGLVEVGQGANGTVDTTEVGDLNPNAKAIVAINPHSAHIAVTRVDGVTSAVSLPLGGLISG
ncbi:MAG TPA: hypothetical protein VFP47_17860, partial [Pyrinomonadaceae bacterium]|nr:hypothetical protein [Pyrinomonadaceae bacterium]